MTSASTWRDAEPEQFAATILVAAEQLGVLPLAVEKDYWVCEALRAITSSHPGEVVFKGGTGLEKLRIIRRFSEDLDLLVVGDYGSNRAAKQALKSMVDAAASGTISGPTGGGSGGKPGSFHRSAYLAPPMAHSAVPGAIADASAILIELGQSGGPNPHETQRVESLVGRQLNAAGFDTSAWSDLAALEVAVLHPGRTLIEKLLRINNFANDPNIQAGTHGWSRIGRQFYDVWALLGQQDVLDLLADRSTTGEILTSCFEISLAFVPDKPLPPGGFAACTAFDPDGPLADRLRTEHEVAMRDLYYGTEEPPTFDDVLERVRASRELLDVEAAS
jgi:hypothetical protein